MRNLLSILFILLSIKGFTTNYYPTPGYGKGYFQGDAGTFTPVGGDTVFINAAYEWGRWYITGWNGSPGNPIVVINYGGQVRWKVQPEHPSASMIAIYQSSYIKWVGIGDTAANYYGFKVQPYETGQWVRGVFDFEVRQSRNIDFSHIDIRGGMIGFVLEDNAVCDTMYNYPNFVMDSITVKHCRGRSIWSQFIYAGNTAADNNGERPLTCNGNTVYYKPSRMGNIKITNNDVDSTGRPGIQLSAASTGWSEIAYNTVKHSGLQGDEGQAHNIAIGAYSKVWVHHNTCVNSLTDGINSISADSVTLVENNSIDSSGYLRPFTYMYLNSFYADTATTSANTRPWPVGIRWVVRNKTYNAKNKPVAKNNYFGKIKAEELGLLAQANWFDTAQFCGNTSLDGTINVKQEDYGSGSPTPYTLSSSCPEPPAPPFPGFRRLQPGRKVKSVFNN